MKTSFPTPNERLVASALLLLSNSDCPFTCFEEDEDVVEETSARPITKMIVKKKKTERDCKHNDSVSSRRFRIVSTKVVRKRRSKTQVFPKSPECKMTSSDTASSSCVTVTSSCESIRRRSEEEEKEYLRMRKKMKAGSAPNMRRRAEAILGLLESGRSYSEVDMRKVFGDNPTTSKALRLLLMLEEVKRSGAGGPRDPYIYTLPR